MQKGDKHPWETSPPNFLLKQPKLLAQDPRSYSLNHQDKYLCHTLDFCNKTLNSRLNLANHFSYPLFKFLVCLTFQFAAFTRFILSEIKMSGEHPAQFDGLYKISQVFRLVLELNDPPSQFPLSRNMTTFLGIMLTSRM